MRTMPLILIALLACTSWAAAHSVPPVRPAHRPRPTAQDASLINLKQIGLAITMYAQDHDQRLPDAGRWVDEIMPYLRTESVFHDPIAPASQKWGYAYNRTLSHAAWASLPQQASTVLAFESRKGVKNASDAGQSVPRPGRYHGGTDYLFVDGHVKWFRDGTKLSYALSGR